jgi:hypothetical protein
LLELPLCVGGSLDLRLYIALGDQLPAASFLLGPVTNSDSAPLNLSCCLTLEPLLLKTSLGGVVATA